jgi:hypothetical protein
MRIATAALVLVSTGLALAGCVENEQTLFVEHMKIQPKPPSCVSNTGDEKAAEGLIDLAIAHSFGGYYYVTNAAMVREEYDNLRAETDGVFIEGMEVYVVGTSGGIYGSSEYYEYQMYIPPESSDIVPAIAVPNSVVQELASGYGCNRADSYVPAEMFVAGTDALEMAEDYWGGITVEYYDSVYAVVRFLGHTGGGSDLETPEYSFLITPCCNCLVDWSCCTSPCDAFCGEPDELSSCNPGVLAGNGTLEEVSYDCRNIYRGALGSWDDPAYALPVSCETCTLSDGCS